MRRALLVSVCVVAAGCVTSRMQRLDPDVRPPRAAESIVVFDDAPNRPYTVIAHIDSQVGNVFQSFDDLRARIVEQAAELGGEAVIVGPESKETTYIILTTGMFPSETKKLAGDVIVFR